MKRDLETNLVGRDHPKHFDMFDTFYVVCLYQATPNGWRNDLNNMAWALKSFFS